MTSASHNVSLTSNGACWVQFGERLGRQLVKNMSGSWDISLSSSLFVDSEVFSSFACSQQTLTPVRLPSQVMTADEMHLLT